MLTKKYSILVAEQQPFQPPVITPYVTPLRAFNILTDIPGGRPGNWYLNFHLKPSQPGPFFQNSIHIPNGPIARRT